MEKRYKEVMKILYIKENEQEELLINNIDRTLDIIKLLNNAEVDLSLEPLEYLNEGVQNKMRSKDETRINAKNLKTNNDNYFVVKK